MSAFIYASTVGLAEEDCVPYTAGNGTVVPATSYQTINARIKPTPNPSKSTTANSPASVGTRTSLRCKPKSMPTGPSKLASRSTKTFSLIRRESTNICPEAPLEVTALRCVYGEIDSNDVKRKLLTILSSISLSDDWMGS